MRCEEAGLLISAGLDGELDTNCAARLRAHLAECAHCSAEQAVLAGTVRLLRELPEVEPPAELRRRIDGALLQVERRAQPRPLILGGRLHSRTPGWAWGVAAGAAAGAAVLMLTRGQPSPQKMVVLPKLPSPRVVTQSHATRRPIEGHAIRKLPVTAPKRPPAEIRPQEPAPALMAETPPTSAPSDVMPPAPPRHVQVAHARPARSHVVHRLVVSAYPAGPMAAPVLPAAHPTPSHPAASDASGQSTDDSRPRSSSTPPDSVPTPSDPDMAPDTSGMTKMALGEGDMSSAPETADDDLSELRRRLIDRPLQIPELGQQRPSESRRSNRDGWIRF